MSDSISVTPVTSARENKEFINFPYTLYKKILKNPYWAGPLRIDEKTLMDRNKFPFYQHATMQQFLARKNGKVVGRIAGIIDEQYHKYREKEVAYFGFFECINDREAAHALFDAALAWARERGMKRSIGPISPCTNHILGVLLDDFEGVPMIQVPYNASYYPGLYDAYGFGKEKDHLAFLVDKDKLEISDKIKRVVNLVRKNKRLRFETVDMKKYDQLLEMALDLYNKAWADNSDFVPWTEDEFRHMAKDLKLVIHPELTFVAYVDGQPAGLSICLRNINEVLVKMNGRLLPTGIFKLLLGLKKTKTLRLAILGVVPEYRRMGIDALFVLETYERGVAMGYSECEVSLILEDNYPLVNLLTKWGVRLYRNYRVYKKDLG
jgi:GNAT superfamily N-acetyltransferase